MLFLDEWLIIQSIIIAMDLWNKGVGKEYGTRSGYWELWKHLEKTIGKTYGMFCFLSLFLKIKDYHIMHDFYNVVHF